MRSMPLLMDLVHLQDDQLLCCTGTHETGAIYSPVRTAPQPQPQFLESKAR